jgi:hypothetical protein
MPKCWIWNLTLRNQKPLHWCNIIYTILCVVCLTTTCCKNTPFTMAADPLNNDQSMQKCGIRCADTAPSKIEYNNHAKTEKEEKYWSRNRQSKLLNLQLKGTVNIGWVYSPELCYFTMTVFVRIHISLIIPKMSFP